MLTPRRLEALEALQRLYGQAGEAVHYSLVAARLHISRWTAYGLLRELEGMGLVTRRSAPAAGNPLGGRSRILFAPRAQSATPATADELTRQFRLAFARFEAIGDEAAAARTYLAEASSDVGYQLGFWLSRLEATGRQAGVAGRAILESGSVPLTKLQAISAMGLGSALARLEGSRIAARLAIAGAHFNSVLEEAARASEESLGLLVDAARQPRNQGVIT